MKKILTGFAVAALLVPASTFAAYLNGGGSVIINPSQTINENAYVAGGSVEVSGTVNGDLLAAGGTLNISGKVAKDIMAAGGTINMIGVSAEDARVAGGNVTVGGTYAGELVLAGGQVTVTSDAHVAKDSYIGGGTVVFNGNEAGTLTVSGGTISINGTVGKDVIIKRGQKVMIGANAVIKGNLEYTSPIEATIESGAQIAGATTYHQAAAPARANDWAGPLAALLTLWWLAKFAMILLATYLLWYLWRNDMTDIIARETSSWKSFGQELFRGFSFMILVPIASVIALFTVIGAIPALVALLLYGVMMLLTVPVAIIVVASLLMKRRTNLTWYHILLGALVFEVAAVIPFIGWIAYALVFLASLGALAGVLGRRFSRKA